MDTVADDEEAESIPERIFPAGREAEVAGNWLGRKGDATARRAGKQGLAREGRAGVLAEVTAGKAVRKNFCARFLSVGAFAMGPPAGNFVVRFGERCPHLVHFF
jgi:hypothetical protein